MVDHTKPMEVASVPTLTRQTDRDTCAGELIVDCVRALQTVRAL